jgi:acid phosphatase
MKNVTALLFTLLCLSTCVHAALPVPDKTIVVFMENRSFEDVLEKGYAPAIKAIASVGATFTNYRSVAGLSLSQPNYIAFFTGLPDGVVGDKCLFDDKKDKNAAIKRANLASVLREKYGPAGFLSYAESLPSTGWLGCGKGNYVRKHNPVANFQGTGFAGALPDSVNLSLAAFPFSNLQKLPRLSLMIPNMANDMHDPTGHDEASVKVAVGTGNSWVERTLKPILPAILKNNILLILVWDGASGDHNTKLRTPMIFYGPMVKAGSTYSEQIDHYATLGLLLKMHDLAPLGKATVPTGIDGIWK